MELLSTDFLSALLAIIVIDLVLAGDNAIVIALAARGLPQHLRKPAIIWGTVGAIVVRTAMTLVVVWLLKIPGLLAAGGALLVWIAWKLVIDNDSGDGHKLGGSTTFFGAMKTIVIADALMGLDNVLAVAGAAQGSFLLVVLGLLISIPIVIWGSQLILKYVERFPVIVYIGAGVLAWTAVKMVSSEPLLEEFLAQYTFVKPLAYALAIGGVVIGGFLVNHAQVRSRIAELVVDIDIPTEPTVVTPEGFTRTATGFAPADGATLGGTMSKVLLPVDGSPNALRAVRHAVNQYMSNHEMDVHLLHVRTPLTQHAARFLSRKTRMDFHRDEADKALAPAREMLKRFGVPFTEHVELGDRAETITRAADRLNVGQIIMGTARKNSLTRLIEDSVTNRVLELTHVPVQVVAGESVSRLERFGVPAGVAAALALVVIAVD
jgi:YjbE family integral membrane protein